MKGKRIARRRRARRNRIAGVLAGLVIFTAALTGAGALRGEPQKATESPQTEDRAGHEETLPKPETPQAEELVYDECPLGVETFYDVPPSIDLQAFIVNETSAYDINPAIILGMIERESEFDADAIGDGGEAFGLMQVQIKWHRDRMKKLYVTDLLNPYENVRVGIDYLAELLDKYGGDVEMALIAYNAGPTGAKEDYFSRGVYSNGYSREVLENAGKLVETCGRQ